MASLNKSLLAGFCLFCLSLLALGSSPSPDGPLDDKIGSPAPLFSGKTVAGEQVNLEDYKGHVVILDIWASWCGPCKAEMPYLNELSKKYKDQGLEIIAVNIDDNKENMQDFLSKLEKKPTFTIVFDPEKQVPQLYDAPGMPTTIFIDKQGIIRYIQTGFRDSHRDKYLEQLTALLNQ